MSDSEEVRPSGARVLDALSTIRRHPEWFFRSGSFDVADVIALLVEEATRARALHVSVLQEQSWIRVAADVDWLDGDLAPFYAPTPYERGGRNSSRVEVALTAFCDAVLTWQHGTVHEVMSMARAQHQPPRAHDFSAWARVIMFLPPDAELASTPETRSTRPTLRLIQGEGEDRIVRAVESFQRKRPDA